MGKDLKASLLTRTFGSLYFCFWLILGLYSSDHGKAAWPRQQPQASDFERLGWDGAAWAWPGQQSRSI